MKLLPAFCGAALITLLLAPASAGAPVPLDYKAYDGWSDVRTPALSPDGSALAYVVTPEDADPTLVVRNLANGMERNESRGSAPQFVGNGRFVVFVHLAPRKQIDAARDAGKPESEQPKSGLGILDLRGSTAAAIVDNVKSHVVPSDGGTTIAYLAVPPPAPAGSPSPQPKLADKSKAIGSTLTIRDLAGTTMLEVPNVTEVVESNDGTWIAYATQSISGTGDGVHVYDVARASTHDVMAGSGRYRDLAIARDGSSLAFLSDAATYAQDVPHDALYIVDLRVSPLAAVKAVDAGTGGLAAGRTPNANGTLAFSRDGNRVFFGTAPAPTPQPANTPRPVKVDIWAWNDNVLQSEQRHDADQERKRTYLAVYDLSAKRFAQIETETMLVSQHAEVPGLALGVDDRAYQRAISWLGQDYDDIYSVSIADGNRRLIARRVHDPTLSPGARYVLVWSESLAHWVAYRMSDGRAVVLGAHAAVRFSLEDDDHPEPPQPYGASGWLAGDRGVMIYDRYDVWLANPDTGAAIDLTAGDGRRTHTVYSPVQPNPDALAYDPSAPILLSLVDEKTLASGYARVPASGGVPVTLLRANEVINGFRPDTSGVTHDLADPPIAAKHAAVYTFIRETYRDRQLWTSDTSFTHLQQVSHINPQQAAYRWGNDWLIHYRAADGTPLRARLIVPDGLQRNHSAPLLIYFYETMATSLHEYEQPGPGTSPSLSRYVSNGYVVMLPDVRYRIGHPGASAVNCLLPAVDAAIKTGYVDPHRLGIAGHSWAAYQINYLLTKTHRFRAAEAGAAVDDMFSAYGGIRLESGWVREFQYEHSQSRIGATPWDRPDLYMENSGLFGIKNITTPYLSVHNDADTAVPQFQGIEFITAMRRLGKVAYLFSFDGEKHGITQRENQKYWTVHLDEWFDYWLKGAPRPAWFDGVDYLHRGERNVDALFGETQ